MYFDVVGKEKAIWIPDRTTQLLYERNEKKWFQKWFLWHTG